MTFFTVLFLGRTSLFFFGGRGEIDREIDSLWGVGGGEEEGEGFN